MHKPHTIIIAGAGGIAQAAGLILAEWSEVVPSIFIGNRTLTKAKQVAKWIEDGTTKPSSRCSLALRSTRAGATCSTVDPTPLMGTSEATWIGCPNGSPSEELVKSTRYEWQLTPTSGWRCWGWLCPPTA